MNLFKDKKMELFVTYENDSLNIQTKKYIEDGWYIKYEDLKPNKKWELYEIPLYNEARFYKSYDSLKEAMAAANTELT